MIECLIRGCSAPPHRGYRRGAAGSPQPPRRASRCVTPAARGRDARRAGGAQTFAAELVGTRERYAIEARRTVPAAHWPGPRGPRHPSITCAIWCDPHPYRRGGRARTAPAGAIGPEIVQINPPRPVCCAPGAARTAARRSSPPTAGLLGPRWSRGDLRQPARRRAAQRRDRLRLEHDLRLARERYTGQARRPARDPQRRRPPPALARRRAPGERLVLGCTARLAPPRPT